MQLSTVDASAAELERVLGDPGDGSREVSFARLVESDDRGEMPWPAMDALRDWGFPALLVPEPFGGRLRTFEELFAVCRVVARRDMRVAVSYGTTLLGANPVWLWGDAGQRARLAGRLRAGELGSFAMSERDHGSDLAGCTFSAQRDGERYLLTGEKWPIGNATRGTFCTVYARTGARDFSLLLLDKDELPADRWAHLPRVATIGLRGHDLSGLRFGACPVPASAVLGEPGRGVAQTLKALQVTRTLIGALSLGSLDTGLRIALDHADRRRLYGEPVSALPVIRDILVRAYLDLLIGECVAVPACRAISTQPARISLWSAIVKYFLPVTVDAALAELAAVLSARGYLREGLPARTLQKVQRDHAIAGIFEGTTHVNLAGVAAQLPFVLGRPTEPADLPRLAALFDRGCEAAGWQPDGRRLQLSNGGRDEITGGWPDAVRWAHGVAGASPTLRAVVSELDAAAAGLRSRFAGAQAHPPVLASALAHTHCVLHAAACVLWTWYHRDRDLREGDHLLTACLERLAQRLAPGRQFSAAAASEAHRWLAEQAAHRQLFSLTPIPLA